MAPLLKKACMVVELAEEVLRKVLDHMDMVVPKQVIQHPLQCHQHNRQQIPHLTIQVDLDLVDLVSIVHLVMEVLAVAADMVVVVHILIVLEMTTVEAVEAQDMFIHPLLHQTTQVAAY